MGIERRLFPYGGMRADIPHLRSIESGISHDFDALLRGMMTGLGRPYLIRGFRIKIPSAPINASSLQIEVADSAILHSSATESGTILTVPAGAAVETLNSANTKVIGSFQSGFENYVALDYRRVTDTSTIDQTAGWSASQKVEFQRTVPIARILQYRFVITTNGYGTNLPLYKVKVGTTGTVEYINKGVTSFWRLGTGGSNPNPFNEFAFGNLTNPQTGTIREYVNPSSPNGNPLTVTPGTDTNALDYGDFSIKNFKDWADAVMTRLKKLANSPYWYLDGLLPGGGGSGGGSNLFDVWFDSGAGSVMTGAGSLSYNLVLEATLPDTGGFQALINDEDVLPGDSYIEGLTSGTKATLTTFNANQLIINSLTAAGFTYGETFWNRRIFRPDPSRFELFDYSKSPDRFGILHRKPSATGADVDVASWTYQTVIDGPLWFTIVDVTTVSPHGLQPGQMAEVTGLLASISDPPNGTAWVKEVMSPSSFRYYHPSIQSGTATVAGTSGVRPDAQDRTPYMPRFAIPNWSYVSTAITLHVPNNNFDAPVIVSGDTNSGSKVLINLTSTANIKLGQRVSASSGIVSGSIVTEIISSSSVRISIASGANTVGNSITFKDVVNVNGLTASTNAPNGRYPIDSVNLATEEISFTASLAPTGTAGITADNTFARPDIYVFPISVNDAAPEEYDVTNSTAYALDEAHIYFRVGLDTLPTLGIASGPIKIDGVVATSTVKDPVRVSGITNPSSGTVRVVTATNHGLTNTTNVSFVIYGAGSIAVYVRKYENVDITVINPTTFDIENAPTDPFTGQTAYTNTGLADNVFVQYPDNPSPGPIQWDSDIFVKGIIGDKYFRVPSTATAYSSTDPDAGDGQSPEANRFNVNGQTGTVFVQDGEVAYVILKRNKLTSNGSSFTSAGGSGTISSAAAPLDENGDNLVSGDFVKFEDEPESKWLRIAGTPGDPIVTNSFTLVDDRDQSPSIDHRPPKSGRLVYTKGIYDKIYVKPHWRVEDSADVYWLAVRRDNAGSAKAYFRSLELEPGEVRQINDNAVSNHLRYTGAMTEAAVNPNYTLSDTSADYVYASPLDVGDIDPNTRMVTFEEAPVRGFQKGDRFHKVSGINHYYWTVKEVISTRTVILEEATTNLSVSDTVDYLRENANIDDQDNLTKAIRKDDRELGFLQTAFLRPVYDESVYVQQINMSGSGTVRSGSYIYKGTLTNPTALAWVLHGNAAVTETIESAVITMPGGHASVGANAVLVNIVFGTFSHTDAILQNGSATGRTVNNAGNPPFLAPALTGGSGGTGVELVLPPNKRTQVVGTEFVVFGTPSHYRASSSPNLAGEDLLLIANDTIRQAVLDYDETFGGPKAKIRIVRDMPPNTRLRFRMMSSFGSAISATSTGVSLQIAYNGGATINLAPATPVEITASNVNAGETAEILRGSLRINGGTSQLGGIFNETGDKGFVIGKEADKPKESWTALEAVKSHGSHPGSASLTKTAAQTVTGDTGTIVTDSALTLADNFSYRIKISAVARRSDGPVGIASFTMEGTFYRSGGGALAAGSPMSQINGADLDGNNYAIAFGLSGNDVVAVVYGSLGATVQWALTIESQAVGLAS